MRMGKPPKQRRGQKKGRRQNKDQPVQMGSVVGQLSSDVISSVYMPLFSESATKRLERYADNLLRYEEALQAAQGEKANGTATAVQQDGTVLDASAAASVSPLSRPLFYSEAVIQEFEQTILHDTAKHFTDASKKQSGEWKAYVNAAKFERQLDEKYGMFRGLVDKYPALDLYFRQLQRKYAMGQFSPFSSAEPPLNKATSIILLFMMQRNGVGWQVMLLTSLFLLVGLQPWALVLLVVLLKYRLEVMRSEVPAGMEARMIKPYHDTGKDLDKEGNSEDATRRKLDVLRTPVGAKYDESMSLDGHDTMIVGSGPEALYTAALLSRAGRKVLVLTPIQEDASGCLTLHNHHIDEEVMKKYEGIPFDISASSNVAHLARQQEMLAPALCTTVDFQGGIRFAKIGTEADGFAFEILAIPGVGAERIQDTVPFVLKAAGGQAMLAEDSAQYLGDGWPGENGEAGNSTIATYLAACASINSSASDFYLGKVLPESSKTFRKEGQYQECAIRHVAPFLDRCLPYNAHVRSLVVGMGMKGENIKPNTTSLAPYVTNICAAVNSEGMHYPVGGPRALCHALASVVEQCGGRVVTGVHLDEFIFEEKQDEKKDAEVKNKGEESTKPLLKKDPPRCEGVKLASAKKIMVSGKETPTAVISFLGFITTFIRKFPASVRADYGVPKALPALTERRPVFTILFGIKGCAPSLNLTGADYYRLPAASLALDESDSSTGELKLGEIGYEDLEPASLHESNNSNEDDAVDTENENAAVEVEVPKAGRDKRTRKTDKRRKLRFEKGISWMKISFPSAKDPSFESRYGSDVTTCVVTVEADDDFVALFESQPRIYSSLSVKKIRESGDVKRLTEHVQVDLVETFPQLEGKIEAAQLRGPHYRGLSHNPERYAAQGIKPQTNYPGLLMGGGDLTVGDSFSGAIVSGWLAANAVLDYSMIDYLFLQKSITSDLEKVLDAPTNLPTDGTENLAVPFTPKVPEEDPREEATEMDTAAECSQEM